MTDSPLFMPQGVSRANPQLVEFARRLLGDIEAGRVVSLAIVAVSPLQQITPAAIGSQASELYLGADLLKKQILDAMTGARPGLMV